MQEPDFWDFVMEGGWELLFPGDLEGSFECHSCGRVIRGHEKVEWINKKERILKCPNCGEQLEID